MRANPVNDYISCSRFVVWKRTDERVGELQEPWGGYTGSHMEFDMAGDAGALKPAGIAAMALKFELLKNTINIDKLLKRFTGRTNDIFPSNLVSYQNILK